MKFKTIALAASFSLMGSVAFAQAPIGSSATFGNGAVINRGPVPTVGEDMDFRTDRSGWSRPVVRHRYVVHRHRHVADRFR